MEKKRTRRLWRYGLVAIPVVTIGLALWCGLLWRTIPRREHFPPAPGSISPVPIAQVFTGDDAVEAGVEELVSKAETFLDRPVMSPTDKPYRAPSGDARDYTSLSIYWWPNPITRMPYIHRDGYRNPEAETYDAPRLGKAIDAIAVCARAYAISKDQRFLERAREQLRVWFIDPQSRMNPHLTFAQMMPGWAAGGRQGIVEGLPLVRQFPDALATLEGASGLSAEERLACRQWLGSYLAWLQESRPGRAERDRRNNHGTWHDVQVVAIATALGLKEVARETLRTSLKRLDTQFLADGRQPEELRRTKSFDYSVYNLDAWMHLAELGKRHGIDVWHHRNAVRAGPEQGLQYLERYAGDWPHPQLRSVSPGSLKRLRRRVALLRDAE